MEDPLVRAFLAKVERDEIIPVVPPVPDTDLDDYFALCRAPLRQSQDRRHHPPPLPRRLQPPAQIHPAVGRRPRSSVGSPVDGLALVSALWCRYCYGETDSGAVIEPNDPNWDRLTAQATAARERSRAWLAMSDIYGDTADSPGVSRRLLRLAQGALGRRHRRHPDAATSADVSPRPDPQPPAAPA